MGIIEEATLQVDELKSEIEVTHVIKGDPHAVDVSLFNKDCVDEVSGEAVDIPSQEYDESKKRFIYDLVFNTTKFGTSDLTTVYHSGNITGDSRGSVDFCTRVTTKFMSPSTDARVADPINVSFRDTNFKLKYDLTNNAFASFSLQDIAISTNNIGGFEVDVNTTFSVDAYLCDANYVRIPTSTVYQQDDVINVCLRPFSDTVEISNFEIQMIASDGNTYPYVSYGVPDWNPNLLTTVVKDPTGLTDTLKVSTVIIADMFAGGGTSVDISGNAFLRYKTSKLVERAEFASFYLNFIIENDGSRYDGCFKTLITRIQSIFGNE